MKTNTGPTLVETTGVGEVKQATIKASSKIFNFFADQIYSDKFTAIWRELVANAVDAQKMVGNTSTPVQVTLPSMLEPHASVRDYGCSMDHEFMMNKFMAFTDASTKEHSDDYIGGFGIGSKAPLSYTDQFSIKCYMNGKLRIYSVFKDTEGCPAIAFLSEADSSEPTGVEVSFPVRQDDISSFNDVVVSTLEYFDPQPILQGNAGYEMQPIEYDARGKNWGTRVMSTGTRNNRIIAGGVAYPFDTDKIPYRYKNLREMVSFGLDMYVDIGDVNIALSRESITQDDALYTKLEELAEGIGPEIREQLSKRFESFETKWEATRALRNATKEASYEMANVLRKFAQFKGEQLEEKLRFPMIEYDRVGNDGSITKLKAPMGLDYIAYGSFGYRHYGANPMDRRIWGFTKTEAAAPQFRTMDSSFTFYHESFDKIIYVDQDGLSKPLLRVRKYIQDNPDSQFLVLRKGNCPKSWDEVFKLIGTPPEDMIVKLSSLDPLKITRAKGNAGKAFEYYETLGRPISPSRYGGDKPNTSGQLPTGGGVYVVMDNFNPQPAEGDIELARTLEPKNLIWMNLTHFKASGIENDKEWKSVAECSKEAILKYKREHKSTMYIAAALTHFAETRDGVVHIPNVQELDNFPKRGPLARFSKLYKEHKPYMDHHHKKMRQRVDLDEKRLDKAKDKVRKMWREVNDKHPLLISTLSDWNVRSAVLRRADIMNRLF